MNKLSPHIAIPIGTAVAVMTVVLGVAWMLQGRLTTVEVTLDRLNSKVTKIDEKLEYLLYNPNNLTVSETKPPYN